MPDWLLPALKRRLGDDVVKVMGRHRLSEGGGAAHKWGADPFTLVVNAVCERCNSGWSSQLENQAKPYLLKVITGEACRLDADGQAPLAAWCFKVACMFDQVGKRTAMPRAHIESFYRDRMPSVGVFVYLAYRRRLRPAITPAADGDAAFEEPLAQLKWRSATLGPLNLDICKTVIVLGEMVAQVLAFSQPNIGGAEVPGLLT